MSEAAGGQSSRELRVGRGDTLHSADTLEKIHVLDVNVHWPSFWGVRGVQSHLGLVKQFVINNAIYLRTR